MIRPARSATDVQKSKSEIKPWQISFQMLISHISSESISSHGMKPEFNKTKSTYLDAIPKYKKEFQAFFGIINDPSQLFS